MRDDGVGWDVFSRARKLGAGLQDDDQAGVVSTHTFWRSVTSVQAGRYSSRTQDGNGDRDPVGRYDGRAGVRRTERFGAFVLATCICGGDVCRSCCDLSEDRKPPLHSEKLRLIFSMTQAMFASGYKKI